MELRVRVCSSSDRQEQMAVIQNALANINCDLYHPSTSKANALQISESPPSTPLTPQNKPNMLTCIGNNGSGEYHQRVSHHLL